MKSKYFYIKLSCPEVFKAGDVISSGASSCTYKIIKTKCTDPFWKKILRKIGFKITNYEGYTKAKILKSSSNICR